MITKIAKILIFKIRNTIFLFDIIFSLMNLPKNWSGYGTDCLFEKTKLVKKRFCYGVCLVVIVIF